MSDAYWYLGKEAFYIKDEDIHEALKDAGIRTQLYAVGPLYEGVNKWYHVDALLDYQHQLTLPDGRTICVRGTAVQWATKKLSWEQ